MAALALGGAARAEPLDLSRLQVYVTGSIAAERSDYQGPVAAGGAIDVSDFDVDGDLTAGGPLRFTRGKIRGTARASDRQLDRVFASGAGSVAPGAFRRPAGQLAELAARLGCAPASVAPVISRGTLLGTPVTLVRITATRDVDVADIDAKDLASRAPNGLRVLLNGTPGSRLVVRVHGEAADLSHVGFSSQGGLTPSDVVFAFPEARSVTVASAGGAAGGDGTHWGVPGSIVAPRATLHLAAVTVTGQVFAAGIDGLAGLPSGQVNRLAPEAAGPFVPSRLLQSLGNEPRHACDTPM